jgi:hypothetical protein
VPLLKKASHGGAGEITLAVRMPDEAEPFLVEQFPVSNDKLKIGLPNF